MISYGPQLAYYYSKTDYCLFIQALNRNLNLQRFRVLYVTGNYSRLLSRLDRRFVDLTNELNAH